MTDKDWFELARSLVESEDKLVDNRIGWVLTFNGFLLAAYMGTYVIELQNAVHPLCYFICGNYLQELTTAQNAITFKIDLLRYLITIVGAVSGLLAMIGITAAFRAIHNVKIGLDMRIKSMKDDPDTSIPFSLTADKFSNSLGMLSPLLLCILIVGTWLVLLFETASILPYLVILAISLLIVCWLVISVFNKHEAQNSKPKQTNGTTEEDS